MIRADLHIHTYFSDGLMSPAEVVNEAAVNGLNVIAVTDHDTMLATGEVSALAKERGIISVRGIEVSAYEGELKLHTLGYNVDYKCSDYKSFAKRLYDGSVKRAEDIIYKLNKNGVALSMEEVLAQKTVNDTPIHGMHISRAGAAKGYASSPFNFYLKYLAGGKCASSCICRLTPEETIEVIDACGGFASLAHPARIDLDRSGVAALVKKLVPLGLGGIEGVYSTHTANDTAYYKELAKTYRLVLTGGSDTHYKEGNKKIGTPAFYIDEALAEKLKIEIR
ncbi:MAG: PHP domain-containing protein [Clostridia bacterium]|nr:PHP domain-containing protein [Clostridia bacterium]